MKKLIALMLALCLAAGCAFADGVASPTDADPTPTEASAPTPEPTKEPEVTPEPTEEPETTPEPTKEPEATPEASEEPEATPETSEEPEATPEVSEEPEVTPEPAEPTVEPVTPATPTDVPAAPEAPADPPAGSVSTPTDVVATSTDIPATTPADGPMYVLMEGVKVYGQPDDLIPLGLVIHLYTRDVIELQGYTSETLSGVKFAMDRDVFSADKHCIYLSVRDPNGFVKQDTMFLWVGLKEEAPKDDGGLEDVLTGTDEDVLEHEIQATPANYSASKPCRPSFSLTAFPSIEEGMTFAVILNGGEPQAIAGSTFVPETSGEYRFALLDTEGRLLARSAAFTVEIAPATPTPVPTATPTAVPTAVPAITPSPEPTAEPTPEPTVEPTVEPTPEPTVEPTAEPEPTMNPDEEALWDAMNSVSGWGDRGWAGSSSQGVNQAWTESGGAVLEGDLHDLLSQGDTIYILTEKIIVLNMGATALAGKTLLPDPDAFGSGYVVKVSNASEYVASADSLFVWVEAQGSASVASASISVEASSYAGGSWQNTAPVFTLSSEPGLSALGEGYAYAVSAEGSMPISMDGVFYFAEEEGAYTLVFSILAPDGSILAESAGYAVQLDTAAPLMQVTGGNGKLQVTGGDTLSGPDAVSLDGGDTWQPLTEATPGVGVYVHTVSQATVLPAGSILLRDKAGNTTAYPEEVSIRVMSGGFGGRGGGGRATSHSESTVEAVVAYDGVELILNDGSMTELTVGDEVLDLQLVYSGAAEKPEDYKPAFTAAFADLDDNDAADTLVLSALDVSGEAAPDFTWAFSGQVYKKLAASGIDYMMLRVGDRVTLLSTAGFTAGIRYNMFRADGLVSKDFRYSVRMAPREELMEMSVTVEGDTWLVTDDPADEFYYYDVYHGSLEDLDSLEG